MRCCEQGKNYLSVYWTMCFHLSRLNVELMMIDTSVKGMEPSNRLSVNKSEMNMTDIINFKISLLVCNLPEACSGGIIYKYFYIKCMLDVLFDYLHLFLKFVAD